MSDWEIIAEDADPALYHAPMGAATAQWPRRSTDTEIASSDGADPDRVIEASDFDREMHTPVPRTSAANELIAAVSAAEMGAEEDAVGGQVGVLRDLADGIEVDEEVLRASIRSQLSAFECFQPMGGVGYEGRGPTARLEELAAAAAAAAHEAGGEEEHAPAAMAAAAGWGGDHRMAFDGSLEAPVAPPPHQPPAQPCTPPEPATAAHALAEAVHTQAADVDAAPAPRGSGSSLEAAAVDSGAEAGTEAEPEAARHKSRSKAHSKAGRKGSKKAAAKHAVMGEPSRPVDLCLGPKFSTALQRQQQQQQQEEQPAAEQLLLAEPAVPEPQAAGASGAGASPEKPSRRSRQAASGAAALEASAAASASAAAAAAIAALARPVQPAPELAEEAALAAAMASMAAMVAVLPEVQEIESEEEEVPVVRLSADGADGGETLLLLESSATTDLGNLQRLSDAQDLTAAAAATSPHWPTAEQSAEDAWAAEEALAELEVQALYCAATADAGAVDHPAEAVAAAETQAATAPTDDDAGCRAAGVQHSIGDLVEQHSPVVAAGQWSAMLFNGNAAADGAAAAASGAAVEATDEGRHELVEAWLEAELAGKVEAWVEGGDTAGADTGDEEEAEAAEQLDSMAFLEAEAADQLDSMAFLEAEAAEQLDSMAFLEAEAADQLESMAFLEAEAAEKLDSLAFLEAEAADQLDSMAFLEAEAAEQVHHASFLEAEAAEQADNMEFLRAEAAAQVDCEGFLEAEAVQRVDNSTAVLEAAAGNSAPGLETEAAEVESAAVLEAGAEANADNAAAVEVEAADQVDITSVLHAAAAEEVAGLAPAQAGSPPMLATDVAGVEDGGLVVDAGALRSERPVLVVAVGEACAAVVPDPQEASPEGVAWPVPAGVATVVAVEQEKEEAEGLPSGAATQPEGGSDSDAEGESWAVAATLLGTMQAPALLWGSPAGGLEAAAAEVAGADDKQHLPLSGPSSPDTSAALRTAASAQALGATCPQTPDRPPQTPAPASELEAPSPRTSPAHSPNASAPDAAAAAARCPFAAFADLTGMPNPHVAPAASKAAAAVAPGGLGQTAGLLSSTQRSESEMPAAAVVALNSSSRARLLRRRLARALGAQPLLKQAAAAVVSTSATAAKSGWEGVRAAAVSGSSALRGMIRPADTAAAAPSGSRVQLQGAIDSATLEETAAFLAACLASLLAACLAAASAAAAAAAAQAHRARHRSAAAAAAAAAAVARANAHLVPQLQRLLPPGVPPGGAAGGGRAEEEGAEEDSWMQRLERRRDHYWQQARLAMDLEEGGSSSSSSSRTMRAFCAGFCAATVLGMLAVLLLRLLSPALLGALLGLRTGQGTAGRL